MYLENLFNLKGKVAAVIGAGGHLCSEMARSFARAGCKVVIIDLRLEKAQNSLIPYLRKSFLGLP